MRCRVLVAGFATRHVAQSAHRAGHAVYAVDHFCDLDLDWYTNDRIRFEDLDDLPSAIEEMCSRYRFDMLVVTSGAEDLPVKVPVCGTPAEKIRRFLDKLEIQHFFEDLQVPVPDLVNDGEYPAFFKPCRGAGGWRNAVIGTDAGRKEWEDLYPDVPYLRQRVVTGIPASVCCVTDGEKARAIATNEQILRGEDGAEFGFCGSITPCTHPQSGTMTAYAERIAAASGCTGTVGIDFVLGEESYAIEINPRFQATVDTVEMATGQNLFELHRQACGGILPGTVPAPRQSAVRRILFADRDMTVTEDLTHLAPIIADIPWPGTFLEKGQALVSVFGRGTTRAGALGDLDKNIRAVQQYLR